ncbi:(Fe-S)-binding protein [Meiothermus granaticius]|uniref:NAD(P)H-quinone oxidoreductase subunit I, chloroplastic n=1 Tax=Meiothermus granaticius NBRC 107808 TaxID=1227551 RepID=A0A399FDM6_9DEIN|nr:heterodisulfide reductase-related iron-sulfur binding cluster [Meiothermus granaticius]RIH92941.1 NAD(P)H-quinone oxidoreductase subunit I, chloroplastic [Meiothermus granaticius NBRC 107808]GEM86221.1 iron-sulfur-binding protein [Meiothermus granaticius NBRC 107808]
MLSVPEKILFVIAVLVALYYGGWRFYQVYRAIRRGQPENRFDHLAARLGRGLWAALTQQTVFKKRPWVSLLHAFVFYGFIYYLLLNVLDVIEGLFPVVLRGGAWNGINLTGDLLTALILLGMIGLVIRRRSRSGQHTFSWNPKTPLHEKVRSGIPRDSAIVATFILFHVGSRLLHRSAQSAELGNDPFQPVAGALGSLLAPLDLNTIAVIEHLFWWGAIGSILVFLPYFAHSKHIHLFLAPLNLAFKKEKPGALRPMDFEKAEETGLGVAKLEDFAWPRLLDAYSCIQCNRCQEVCPAYTTGKALSPAAMLISERYELNDLLPAFASGQPSPRPLMEFATNEESIWACTTCNACIEVCPVGNEQMLHIIDIRRERVMMQGEFPAQLNNAFRGLERNGNPWNLGQDKRMGWAEGLPFEVQTVEQNPSAEVLYWVGCAPSYDPRAQKTARAFAELLSESGVSWAVLGKQEKCTGDAARRAGNEYLFAQLAEENVAVLNAWQGQSPAGAKPKTIVTTCPHCFHTLANEYRDFGGTYTVKHHSQYITELLEAHKLQPLPMSPEGHPSVVYHDPCYLGRHNGVTQEPREVLGAAGLKLLEPSRHGKNSFCCGAGGAQFWKEEEPGTERVSANRYRELKGTGASTIAVGCPFCMAMMNVETAQEPEGSAPQVLDLAELVLQGIRKGDAKAG